MELSYWAADEGGGHPVRGVEPSVCNIGGRIPVDRSLISGMRVGRVVRRGDRGIAVSPRYNMRGAGQVAGSESLGVAVELRGTSSLVVRVAGTTLKVAWGASIVKRVLLVRVPRAT